MLRAIHHNSSIVEVPVRSFRKDVVRTALLVVDQTPQLVNHVNKFGWPMSDIQLLMQANTDLERSALAARLQELDLNSSASFNKLSDEDKILLLKPNWVQTPAEIERFTTQQTEYLQYKVQRDKVEKLRAEAETSTTESSVTEPAAASVAE